MWLVVSLYPRKCQMWSYANDVQILPFLPRSLGLVLPSYSENHIKANLSDQILQVQCKYQGQANTKPAYLSFFPKKLPVPPSHPSRPINGSPSPFLWHHSSVGPSVDSRESESGRVLLWNPTPPLPSSLLSSCCSVLRWFFFPCTDAKKKPSLKTREVKAVVLLCLLSWK